MVIPSSRNQLFEFFAITAAQWYAIANQLFAPGENIIENLLETIGPRDIQPGKHIFGIAKRRVQPNQRHDVAGIPFEAVDVR